MARLRVAVLEEVEDLEGEGDSLADLLRPSLIIVDEPPDLDRLPEGTLVVPIDPPSSKG